VDLDKVENKIKENTELEILLIAAALAAPTAPVTTPIILTVVPVTLITAFIALVIAFTALATTPVFTGTAILALLN